MSYFLRELDHCLNKINKCKNPQNCGSYKLQNYILKKYFKFMDNFPLRIFT